ncbi:MAG: hypothetical protein IPJ34_20720 [Myxococcales bacterium]|nr:hypothetical protein [Myxococcales bacterium]
MMPIACHRPDGHDAGITEVAPVATVYTVPKYPRLVARGWRGSAAPVLADTKDYIGGPHRYEVSVAPAEAATIVRAAEKLAGIPALDDAIEGVLWLSPSEGIGLSRFCRAVSWWKAGVTTYRRADCSVSRAFFALLPVSDRARALESCHCE